MLTFAEASSESRPLLGITIKTNNDAGKVAFKVRKEMPVEEHGRTGIRIECRKSLLWGHPLWEPKKPYAIINRSDRIELDWDKRVHIPLPPHTIHHIIVGFPYLDAPCKPVLLTVKLEAGEVQDYQYSTGNSPLVVGEGKIKRVA